MKPGNADKNTRKVEKITRRSFLSRIVTIWAALLSLPFLYGITEYLNHPGKKFTSSKNRIQNIPEDTFFSLSELPENSSKFILIDDEPVLVIRKSGEDIIAFSAVCTHLNCLVGYRKNEKDIICNCHESTFNLDGVPLSGPAKKQLSKYKVIKEGDKITINNL